VNIYLDIETIPAQRPDVLEEIRQCEQEKLDAALAAIKPPGNYKKQDTIDEWMATEAPKLRASLTAAFDQTVDECYRKTSFDGAFGQVCVIGWALDDEGPEAATGTEAEMFRAFSRALHNVPPNEAFNSTVIGHNVSAFDLRFLTQRHIINGIKPNFTLSRAAQAKPWEADKVFDTMVQWSGAGGKVSLDKLCKALGLPGKGDMDGSKVWDYVQAGRLDEVVAYCKDDVRKVREVHRRMTFAEVPEFLYA
jgi:DNA polymerase elongation subunit (family B)